MSFKPLIFNTELLFGNLRKEELQVKDHILSHIQSLQEKKKEPIREPVSPSFLRTSQHQALGNRVAFHLFILISVEDRQSFTTPLPSP